MRKSLRARCFANRQRRRKLLVAPERRIISSLFILSFHLYTVLPRKSYVMPHPQPYKTGPLQKTPPDFVELRKSRLTSCRLPPLMLAGVSKRRSRNLEVTTRGYHSWTTCGLRQRGRFPTSEPEIQGTTRGVRSKRPRSNASVYVRPRGEQCSLRESGSQVGVPKM
jgi:hypothetical protein